MTTPDQLAASVDREALTPVVRRALDNGAVEIVDWQRESLPYVNARPDHRGIYRFSGHARDGEATRRWSAILKLLLEPVDSPVPASHPMYWKREPLAYQSGLLDDLPGLAAPRCYGVHESPDGAVSLWLEEVWDEHAGGWPVESYGLAARHLGRFNGAYVEERPLPKYEWLAAGRPPGLGGTSRRVEKLLRDEETWRPAHVRRAFPVPIAERAIRQFEDRRAFRAAAKDQPPTLCHLDAASVNLFARRRPDGTRETVAIDWELVGVAPLTSDITYLVVQSLRRFDVDMADASRLEEVVLDGYIDGLRDAGWRGDAVDVQRGYLAGVALRLGLIPSILHYISNENEHEGIERVWGRPAWEVIERWAQLAYFVLDRADEARRLLEASD